MKKRIFAFFIILIFLLFVFFLGFVSLRIPSGSVGILTSNTSGVYSRVIENGKFCWRWEALIPKNSKIIKLSKNSLLFNQSFNGSLPSAEIYSALIKGNPDFSYSFDFDILLSVSPEDMPYFVNQKNIQSEDEYMSELKKTAKKIADNLSQKLIQMNENTVIASYDVQFLISELDLQTKYKPVKIDDIYIKKANVPDLKLYKIAQKSYEKFQDIVDEKLSEYAREHADKIMSDERSVKKLTKIGEVLKQYPELNTLLTNGSTAEVLKAINDIK